MMANYTMEIRQMIDNPLIGLFTFDYDFYSDNPSDKEEFEKLFSEWYYFREIGFETPEHFKKKLQAKLNLVMPYYRQLALTEWNKVRTIEQMMTSKNLKETTTHEQSIIGNNESTSNGNPSTSSTSESNSTETVESSVTQSGTESQTGKVSNLADGVASVSLLDGYLTSTSQTDGTTSQTTTHTDNQTATQSGTANTSSDASQSIRANNEQSLKESTTFHSTGDIGIQTPAYAITEWRKVIININQMLIEECNDLFMKLY